MTDLDGLRALAPRRLAPPYDGAAEVRRAGRRRLHRAAAVASSGVVVVAVLAAQLGSHDSTHGLRMVHPVPPATTPATTDPSATPPSRDGRPGPAAYTAAGTVATLPVATPTLLPSLSPSASKGPLPPKTLPGENMPRVLVDRAAAACANASPPSTTYCGRVTGSVGQDRVVTLTIEVCAAQANVEATSLTYPDELETDAYVYDGGQALWRWSRGRTWEREPHTLPLTAGQCYDWTAQWDPVDDDGNPLPAGTYDVTATSRAGELGDERSWTTPVVLP